MFEVSWRIRRYMAVSPLSPPPLSNRLGQRGGLYASSGPGTKAKRAGGRLTNFRACALDSRNTVRCSMSRLVSPSVSPLRRRLICLTLLYPAEGEGASFCCIASPPHSPSVSHPTSSTPGREKNVLPSHSRVAFFLLRHIRPSKWAVSQISLHRALAS